MTWHTILTRLFANGVAEVDPATKKPIDADAGKVSFYAQYRTAQGMSSRASIELVNEDFENFIRDTGPVIISATRAETDPKGQLVKKMTRGGIVQNSRIGDTLILLYHTKEDRNEAATALSDLFPELTEEERIVTGEVAAKEIPALPEMLDIPNVAIPSRIGTPTPVGLEQVLILTVPANPQGLYSFIRREDRQPNAATVKAEEQEETAW